MIKWHKEALRGILSRIAREADDINRGYSERSTVALGPSDVQIILAAFVELMPGAMEEDDDKKTD